MVVAIRYHADTLLPSDHTVPIQAESGNDCARLFFLSMKGERAIAALSTSPATDGLASVTNAGSHCTYG
jgi:hypothetical protein